MKSLRVHMRHSDPRDTALKTRWGVKTAPERARWQLVGGGWRRPQTRCGVVPDGTQSMGSIGLLFHRVVQIGTVLGRLILPPSRGSVFGPHCSDFLSKKSMLQKPLPSPGTVFLIPTGVVFCRQSLPKSKHQLGCGQPPNLSCERLGRERLTHERRTGAAAPKHTLQTHCKATERHVRRLPARLALMQGQAPPAAPARLL